MAEQRFNDLREALLRAGVATRHVRRAVLETESHFAELFVQACGLGISAQDARIEAHRRLGTNQVLVLRYAARPELRAWSRRRPALWFALLPLVAYVTVSAATFATVLAVGHRMAPSLHQIRIPPQVTYRIDLIAQLVMLWFYPMSVAIAFAALAYRRRVAMRWPAIGIASTSAVAALGNVVVMFTGGPTPGAIGAGMTISPQSLPGQVARAAFLASLALAPHGSRRAGRSAIIN